MGYYLEMGRRKEQPAWTEAEIHAALVGIGMHLDEEDDVRARRASEPKASYYGHGLLALLVNEVGTYAGPLQAPLVSVRLPTSLDMASTTSALRLLLDVAHKNKLFLMDGDLHITEQTARTVVERQQKLVSLWTK